jgi:hypothetical protein
MSDQSGQPGSPSNVGAKKTASFWERTSNLWKLVEPYKDILALGSTILAVISGSVAWAVAHFATESELFYLECRVNSSIETQYLPMQTALIATSIEWRSSQIRQMAQLGNTASSAVIVQITAEINDLTKQQNTLAADIKKKVDERAQRCNQEAPQKTIKANGGS